MAKYEVIGNHAVAGVAPGNVVELPDEQAAQLTAAGHVRPKRKKAATKDKPSIDGEEG